MPTAQHVRKMGYKAMILDSLHEQVGQYDAQARADLLTEEEAAEVHAELARQLYDWAVRITPEHIPDV